MLLTPKTPETLVVKGPSNSAFFCPFAACAGEADIAFVLDASGSIAYRDWQKVIDFVQGVISDMFIASQGVNVAIVTYGDKASRLLCFNECVFLHKP